MTLYIDFVRVYRTRCSLWGLNPLGPLTAYTGAPSRIRTDDLLITNQMLWPTELSGHKKQDLLGENLVEKTLQTKCFWLIFWAKEMTFCSIHCCITSIAEFAISTISWEIHHISPFSTKK